MGAKHFGARVLRLEDPALLTGRGRFVDDMMPPGVAACLLRAQPACACGQSARSTAPRRGEMPGVHAVLTADDLPARMASSQIPMLVPNPAIKTPRTQLALARREVCYVGQSAGGGDCRKPLPRRGCRRRGGGRLRRAAGGERLPRCRQARRRARAQRPCQQHRRLRSDELWRRGHGICRRGARVRGRAAAASRRRHAARDPRRARELRSGRPTCSPCGPRPRRRISRAARSPTCSSAISN